MSSSLPDGYVVRSGTDEDVETVAALMHASEEAVRGHSQLTADDVRDWWRLAKPESDSWIIERAADAHAAGLLVARSDVPNFSGVVAPHARGRGLGSALIRFGEARARELSAPALRIGTFADDHGAVALLRARGYRVVRRYRTMRIDLVDAPVPRWPAGIAAEPFHLDDARAFYDALNDAFADEWGWVRIEYEEWLRLRVHAEDADTTLWFLVRDGDEIAAVVRNDAQRYGGGWVGAIGVRPAWRRRGIGLALLQHTLAAFFARGIHQVRLGVDVQNASGATRLYERAGMVVETEEVVYERALG